MSLCSAPESAANSIRMMREKPAIIAPLDPENSGLSDDIPSSVRLIFVRDEVDADKTFHYVNTLSVDLPIMAALLGRGRRITKSTEAFQKNHNLKSELSELKFPESEKLTTQPALRANRAVVDESQATPTNLLQERLREWQQRDGVVLHHNNSTESVWEQWAKEDESFSDTERAENDRISAEIEKGINERRAQLGMRLL